VRIARTRPSGPLPALRPGRRPGAAALEFAVVGAVFFLVVLGIFELGRLLMVQHLLTNAARQGCRVGVLQGKSTSQSKAEAVNALTAQGIQGETASVEVNDGSADASTAKSGDEITVIVTVPARSVTWVPGASYLPANLTGRYTLRRE
jgi:Flp pilus assembly protein TadG